MACTWAGTRQPAYRHARVHQLLTGRGLDRALLKHCVCLTAAQVVVGAIDCQFSVKAHDQLAAAGRQAAIVRCGLAKGARLSNSSHASNGGHANVA